ncbi:MAG TPA: hypothetical protein VE262_04465 [Blastocatellia bacterium]|nr:hypothetical protein [Blastocatellia bacterium]
MIRVLMFDLYGTLVRGDSLFPHAREALAVVSKFETSAGDPLDLCLVSDFDMPAPPATPQKTESIFNKYISILNDLDLQDFFEPVRRHVTLSAHAGAPKPDRRVFEKALERLGTDAHLSECLFITENKEHAAACRKLGMVTLEFNPLGPGEGDFHDWSEAPSIIAQTVAPDSFFDMQLALKLRLATAHDMELVTISTGSTKGRIRGRAKVLHPVTLMADEGSEKVQVPVPVDVEIEMSEEGKIKSVKAGEPDPEYLAESAHFIETLREHGQIASEHSKPTPGQTYQEETDEKGRKLLKHIRSTALPEGRSRRLKNGTRT